MVSYVMLIRFVHSIMGMSEPMGGFGDMVATTGAFGGMGATSRGFGGHGASMGGFGGMMSVPPGGYGAYGVMGGMSVPPGGYGADGGMGGFGGMEPPSGGFMASVVAPMPPTSDAYGDSTTHVNTIHISNDDEAHNGDGTDYNVADR